MAKSAREWRVEWLNEYRYWVYLRGADWREVEVRRADIRRDMANLVLGYAMARGWYHV